MSSSKKQHLRSPPDPDAGPAAKRARPEPATGPIRVELNRADCDLDFNVDGNGLEGHGHHDQGFAYCWSGARANVGITGGKYCFGCKILAEQMVDMSDTPSDQQHVCRVGISRGDDPVGNLGESLYSFGFGGTGKFSNARKFSDYGEKFGVGDTIVCAVDLDNKPLATIGFSKNGKWLGIALQFDATSQGLSVVGTPLKNLPWESSMFPHVLLKNVMVQLQFSIEDGLIPIEGYRPWNYAIDDGNAIVGPSFLSPEECEVMMMVGLPASGKTTWAEKWLKEHPEKRYVILGTNLALDQMKVPGLLRKQNYGERFERLMDRATGIFNTLLARAAKTPRNYILDQTNVYKTARNRKLKPFLDYRKIAVVVFPTPYELKIRAAKRSKEMGKEVPQDAVNEMLANYVLPMTKDMRGSNEVFDEVIFTELDRVEAQRHLDEMKRALKSPSNSNANPKFSHYSSESSVQSFSSPAAMDREANSAVRGLQSYSRPAAFFPHHENLNIIQDNTAYASPDISVQYQGRLADVNLSLSDTSQYGHYTPLYNSTSTHSHDPSVRQIPPDGYGKPSFESPSSIGRPGYTYPSDPPSYSSPSAHLNMPGVSQIERNASRTPPPYEWHGRHQTTYGTPYPSSSPRLPYGTPPWMNRPHGSWY